MDYIAMVIAFVLLSFLLSCVLCMLFDFIMYELDFEFIKFEKEDLVKKYGDNKSILTFLEKKYSKIYKSELEELNENDGEDTLIDNICYTVNNKYEFRVNAIFVLIVTILVSCFILGIAISSKTRNYEDFEIKYNTYISLLENDSYDKSIISLAEDIANLNIEINEKQRDYKKPLGKYFVDERFMDLEFLTFDKD